MEDLKGKVEQLEILHNKNKVQYGTSEERNNKVDKLIEEAKKKVQEAIIDINDTKQKYDALWETEILIEGVPERTLRIQEKNKTVADPTKSKGSAAD